MNNILIFSLIILLTIAVFVGIYYFNKTIDKLEKRLYSGPVPQGYNETHFRLTGETIPIVKEVS